MGSSLFGPIEIDGLRLPPDKASTVMTDHLLTGLSCLISGSSTIIYT